MDLFLQFCEFTDITKLNTHKYLLYQILCKKIQLTEELWN